MDAKRRSRPDVRALLQSQRRDGARARALNMLDEQIAIATQPGFYGCVELHLRDGVAERVRVERTLEVPQLEPAA